MKKRMAAVLALCVLLCMHGAVFAAQSQPTEAQPDLTRECSIIAYLKTVTEDPVLDGKVQLLQVASLLEGSGGRYYQQNAAFGTLSFDPVAERGKPETANALADIAVQKNLPYTTAAVSQQGIATFTALAPGLYLLMQTEDMLESYTAIPPCLVLVPDLDPDTNAIIYDMDCYPKPVRTAPPIELEFTGEKTIVVHSGTAPSDTPFSFILTPEKVGQPMPKTSSAVVDPKTGASTVTRKGKGTFSFGKMSLEKEDIGKTYRYTLREVQGTALNYTYDVTVFTITVAVTDKGNGEPQATVTISDDNKKTPSSIVFTNTYSKSDKPDIPNTGQLWWPVAVMGGMGVVLVVSGLIRSRKEEY